MKSYYFNLNQLIDENRKKKCSTLKSDDLGLLKVVFLC